MPAPSISTPAIMTTGSRASPSKVRAMAKVTAAADSTSRPPRRSIQRPPNGLSAAETRKAPDRAVNTTRGLVPTPAAGGSASTPIK